MAKSKTPAKRARRAEENRLRNKSYKSRLKSTVKKFDNSLNGVDPQAAEDYLKQATSLIDKSVSKGVLHKNTAARKKSKLAGKLNLLSSK